MAENRKMVEAADEVKILREAHNKLAVLATTAEIATRPVPRQKMFLGERDEYEHDLTPEPLSYSQNSALTPRQEQLLKEEFADMEDWVKVLQNISSIRACTRDPLSSRAPKNQQGLPLVTHKNKTILTLIKTLQEIEAQCRHHADAQ